jgi:glycosyltransferase involved in cell wall biosynthesis
VLLEAVPSVWERHPEAHFAFVGPGEPLSRRDARLLDVGRVSDVDRARWLARADLLCLPSSSESFGMVVGEAWSHGTPVVVSDIAVLKELVEDSGGGVAVRRAPDAIAGAICSLLDDATRMVALGRAGYDYWLGWLAPAAVTERHLRVYERLLGDGFGSVPVRERSTSSAS